MNLDVKGPNPTQSNGKNLQHVGEVAMEEAWGASQIGPFDFVPPLGLSRVLVPGLVDERRRGENAQAR